MMPSLIRFTEIGETEMTNELEPCPFKNDGKAHSPKLITAMGEAWVLCSCGTSGKAFSGIDAEEKAIEFWNDRYKRTCTNVDPVPKDGSAFYPTPHFKCSECGASYALTDYAYWCPACGAEVIDGD